MTGNRQLAQWLQMRRAPGVLEGIPGTLARDLLFLVMVALYVLIIGQNWAVYAAALMVAAYRHAYAGPLPRHRVRGSR